MRSCVLIAVLVPLLFVGCKRGAKNTAPAKDDSSNVKLQQPPVASGEKEKKEDAPNWLKKPQDKKDQLSVDGPTNTGKQPWNVGPPQGGFTAPVPAAGVVPANPAPADPPKPTGTTFKPVSVDDMKEVWTFIQYASAPGGKMPASALTYAALVEAKSPAAALVKDGSIVVTGSAVRESVWAFEAKAYLSGGLVATQNGVETLTAAELQQRLGK